VPYRGETFNYENLLTTVTQWASWIKSNEKEILSILNDLACKAEEVATLLVDLFSDFGKLNENHT